MTSARTILVTGSAGRIGQAAVKELKSRGWTVRGFDRVPTPGLVDAVVGDLTDPAAVRQAVEGAGVVIHLAATPDDDDFLTKLVPNNIIGVYQVMEAARLAGVRRLMLASSGQVVYWQRQRGQWPIRVEDPPTPYSWYAATKMFLEAAGRAYAEGQGIGVFVVRLGWCPRTAEHAQELIATGWGQDVYLSPGDAGRFFARAVEAPEELRFAILFATSRPVGATQFDLGPARELLGYEPQDRWPEGMELVGGVS